MRNNKMRAKPTLMGFVAVLLLTVVAGGCGADRSEAQTPAGGQVEVLELKVETDQYAAPDLDRAGMSVGGMDVYSGNTPARHGHHRRHGRL